MKVFAIILSLAFLLSCSTKETDREESESINSIKVIDVNGDTITIQKKLSFKTTFNGQGIVLEEVEFIKQ